MYTNTTKSMVQRLLVQENHVQDVVKESLCHNIKTDTRVENVV